MSSTANWIIDEVHGINQFYTNLLASPITYDFSTDLVTTAARPEITIRWSEFVDTTQNLTKWLAVLTERFGVPFLPAAIATERVSLEHKPQTASIEYSFFDPGSWPKLSYTYNTDTTLITLGAKPFISSSRLVYSRLITSVTLFISFVNNLKPPPA